MPFSSKTPPLLAVQRTDDNGTFACAGAGMGKKNNWLCYDMNARDFDLLGYKYSLLSTVGTAGQNLVVP